jgi:DNA-binding IclR family transcriptional regulator
MDAVTEAMPDDLNAYGKPNENRLATPELNYRTAAVENALSLLTAFSIAHPRLTLRQIAERTGFSSSSAYRMTGSLIHLGFLVRTADGFYRLGPMLLHLGKVYEASFDLAQVVRPVMARVVQQTGHTAVFYIREGDKRICLYRHNANTGWVPNIHEGTHLPLDRGTPARVLLAFSGELGEIYDDIRQKGYFIGVGDRDSLGAGVAAPVFGFGGKLVGALGISGLRDDIEPLLQTTVKDAAVNAAAEISGMLSVKLPTSAPKRGRPRKAPA